MRLAELYDRVVNSPSPRALVIAGGVAILLVIAGLLISFTKRTWIGRGLGLVGLCLIMAALFVAREQTYKETISVSITITRFRHPERIRQPILWSMIIVPFAVAGIMWFAHMKTRYRYRGHVPRHLKAGRRLFAQGEFEAALREYNMAIHAAPDLAEAYCRRGLVFHEMGKTDQAMADIDRAIKCDPRMARAYLERGKMRTEKGDFDGALADFGQLMMIRANDPETYLRRGVCLVKKGLRNEAASDFHRVLKLTNHSDYAEPAKSYLRELEIQSDAPPPSMGNGTPVQPANSQPQSQDHVI